MEEIAAEEIVQDQTDFNQRVDELEATVKALAEENEKLSKRLEELDRLPVFSVPTTKSDGFGAIRDIFRKR